MEALLLQDAETQGRDLSAVAADRIAERYAELARLAQGRAEGRALLTGPAHPFDPDAIHQKYAAKYGLPDLSHLSREEITTQADETVANMDPATRAAMEREGLL